MTWWFCFKCVTFTKWKWSYYISTCAVTAHSFLLSHSFVFFLNLVKQFQKLHSYNFFTLLYIFDFFNNLIFCFFHSILYSLFIGLLYIQKDTSVTTSITFSLMKHTWIWAKIHKLKLTFLLMILCCLLLIV